MKLFVLPLLAFLIVITSGQPVRADNQVSAFLYKADPTAKEGFTETYRWRINESDEWRRFEYMMTKMKPGEKAKINPFIVKPDELLILSIKDPNGVTGKDYYLSKNGIMRVTILPVARYFEDSKEFYKLLKEQVTEQKSFEKYPGEKIATEAEGIVIRFAINKDLPNPSWLINTQKNVNLYDNFMRKLPETNGLQFKYDNPFEMRGNFILLLNYPKAPAKFATVGPAGIRLSNTADEAVYLKDEKKYFEYFYDLTRDSQKMKFNVQIKDLELKERGNF